MHLFSFANFLNFFLGLLNGKLLYSTSIPTYPFWISFPKNNRSATLAVNHHTWVSSRSGDLQPLLNRKYSIYFFSCVWVIKSCIQVWVTHFLVSLNSMKGFIAFSPPHALCAFEQSWMVNWQVTGLTTLQSNALGKLGIDCEMQVCLFHELPSGLCSVRLKSNAARVANCLLLYSLDHSTCFLAGSRYQDLKIQH